MRFLDRYKFPNSISWGDLEPSVKVTNFYFSSIVHNSPLVPVLESFIYIGPKTPFLGLEHNFFIEAQNR